MKRKELIKKFMMILNWKKNFRVLVYFKNIGIGLACEVRWVLTSTVNPVAV